MAKARRTGRPSPTVSAQVLLRPASGRSIRGRDAITADSIRDYAPPAEAATLATKTFAASGFDVGHVAGVSFSITASVATFERVFKTHIQIERSGVRIAARGGPSSQELPLGALSNRLRRVIETVTFGRPVDFGPTGF